MSQTPNQLAQLATARIKSAMGDLMIENINYQTQLQLLSATNLSLEDKVKALEADKARLQAELDAAKPAAASA